MQNVIRNMTAAVIAITILVVPFLVVRMGFEIAYIGTSQEIEQLRNDMVGISRGGLTHGGNIGVALGQATSWNQTIRRMQAYNYRWWGDPFIPDGWNNISTIPIPRT